MSTALVLSMTGRIVSGRSIPIHNLTPPYGESSVHKALRASLLMNQLLDIRNRYVRIVDDSPVSLSGSDQADALRFSMQFIPAPAAPPEPEPFQGPIPCQRIIDLP